MSLPILLVTLRGAAVLLGALAAGMCALQVLISATFQGFGSATAQLLRELPREFAAFVKLQPGLIPAGDVNGYLSLGFYHPLFLVMGSAATVTLGAQALAGEIDRGTILYLLARPLPRWRVVLSKGLALPAAAAVVAGAALLGLGAGRLLFGLESDVAVFGLVAANAWLLFLALGSVALLGSAAASSTGQAAGWATTFTLVSFVVDFLADLWEPARSLEPLSVFTYYDPSAVIASKQLPPGDLAFLLAVTVLSTLLAIGVFSRRDVAA